MSLCNLYHVDIYAKQKQDYSQQRKQLRPVLSKHFKLSTISSNTPTVKDFREEHKLPPNRCNLFLELKDITIDHGKDLIDVILMDNVSMFCVLTTIL